MKHVNITTTKTVGKHKIVAKGCVPAEQAHSVKSTKKVTPKVR